jgi:hypothetical protein
VNGYTDMPHGGVWRNGGGGLEASSDHLSADRLADAVGSLGSPSPESATLQLLRGTPRQTPGDVPSGSPGARRKKCASTQVVLAPSVTRTTVPRPTVTRSSASKTAVSKMAVWKTAVSKITVSNTADSNIGRHRRQPSPQLIVRGVALTSYRLALMGTLALLVVVSSVLLALK